MSNYKVLANPDSTDTCTLILSDAFLNRVEKLGADRFIMLGDEYVDSDWGFPHKEDGVYVGQIRNNVALNTFLFILLDYLVDAVLQDEKLDIPVVLKQG
jgi:hypothetical protein